MHGMGPQGPNSKGEFLRGPSGPCSRARFVLALLMWPLWGLGCLVSNSSCFVLETFGGHHPTTTWVLLIAKVLQGPTRAPAPTGETTSQGGGARRTLMEDKTSMPEEKMAGDQDKDLDLVLVQVQDSKGEVTEEVTEGAAETGALTSATIQETSEDGGRTGETFGFTVGQFHLSLDLTCFLFQVKRGRTSATWRAELHRRVRRPGGRF